MSLLGYIGSQLIALGSAMAEVKSHKLEMKKAKNEAIASMRKALNRTRMFLRKPDYSDLAALSEISDLWNDASAKVGVINVPVGEMLGNKSRFWSDHELFIRLGKDNEVMSLDEVVDQIDRIYVEMK
jgi:hypothetical protein